MSLALWAAVHLASGALAAECETTAREVVPPAFLPVEAPQGIAVDADGSFWIASVLSNQVLHLNDALQVIGGFEAAFPELDPFAVTGIAYHPLRDTLFLARPMRKEVWEVEKDGTPTGFVISLASLIVPPTADGETFVKGIAIDPSGHGGAGSLWVMESILTAVYELSFGGDVLRVLCHPYDPDGCPGRRLATPSGDLKLLVEDGATVGVQILGVRAGRIQLLRVDLEGRPDERVLPLDQAGGRASGFAHARVRDARTGERHDALLVALESSAEVHALVFDEATALPVQDLAGSAGATSVDLSWRNPQPFERIDVLREGEVLAQLAGTATSHSDADPPEGIIDYQVAAASGPCVTRSAYRAVRGLGEVLNQAVFDAEVADPFAIRLPVGIAEDRNEYLWITDAFRNLILVYDKDLNPVLPEPLLSPFQGLEDATSAIAYNPAGAAGEGTFFLYNAETNVVAEMNDAGERLGDPFPSGVPSDPEFEATVTAMLYDPVGAGGMGSFWYLDYATSSIQERTRSGDLLRSCVHPDRVVEAPPDRSPLAVYAWGMTPAVPPSAVGGSPDRFASLYVTGGLVRDYQTTRILRVDTASCAATGEEVPVEGMALAAAPIAFGIHRTVHGGRDVLYAVHTSAGTPYLFEVSLSPPRIAAVSGLACRQDAEAPDVTIEFDAPSGLDALEVLRDGVLIATLPGGAASHVDAGVAAGVRTYAVRGVKGGARGDDRACTLRVGSGSLAGRNFLFPARGVHQVAYDRVEDIYLAASNDFSSSGGKPAADRFLFRFDRQLRHLPGDIPVPFPSPRQVAALAARDAAGRTEIYCLGWLPGAPGGTQFEFPLAVIDGEGRRLRSDVAITLPRPRGNLVTFPSGMAWDAASDTFWCLERNSATVLRLSPEGRTLEAFPHPARIHQDGVINYGLAADGARGVLYLSSAGPLDLAITRLVEVTLDGQLTGVEMPLGRPYAGHWGFALEPEARRFAVASHAEGVWDLALYRAFDSVPPVEGFECLPAPGGAHLSWTNAGEYDGIAVTKGTALAALLPGSATEWHDATSIAERTFYRVVARAGGGESPGVVCTPVRVRAFLRGDAEENGSVNITDAIKILNYLFLGREPPPCLDAADVDDREGVNISDAISLLGFLFLAGRSPAEPFPEPGFDPTPDSVVCGP